MNEQQKQERIAELSRKIADRGGPAIWDDDVRELLRLTAPPAEKTPGAVVFYDQSFDPYPYRLMIGTYCIKSSSDRPTLDKDAEIINAAIADAVEAAIAQVHEERNAQAEAQTAWANQREADLERERNSRRHAEAELAKFDRHNKELRAEVKRQQAELERLTNDNASIREVNEQHSKEIRRLEELLRRFAGHDYKLAESSPSGKTGWRCTICGHYSNAPVKARYDQCQSRAKSDIAELEQQPAAPPARPQGDDAPEKVAGEWYPVGHFLHPKMLKDLQRQREAGRREGQAVELPIDYAIRRVGQRLYVGMRRDDNAMWTGEGLKYCTTFAAALADVKAHAGKNGGAK